MYRMRDNKLVKPETWQCISMAEDISNFSLKVQYM